MLIFMFSIVKTYCINATIIYLSKFISKLSENCTLVFRHINVVIWHSIRACDVPLWKLTAMHCVIDLFINGSICMGTRVALTLILTQILTLTTLKTLIAVSNSLWTQMSSIANIMPKRGPLKCFQDGGFIGPWAHGSEHWPVFITWLFAIYGTFTVIVRASLFYGTCCCVNLRNGTERNESLRIIGRKCKHLLHSTRYFLFKTHFRFDARNYMSPTIRVIQTSALPLTFTLLRNLQKTSSLLCRINVSQWHEKCLKRKLRICTPCR